METISSWDRFAEVLGTYASTPRPLQAMRAAGLQLGGELAQAFRHEDRASAVDLEAFGALVARHGVPPPMRITIGAASPELETRRPGDHGASIVANLAFANEMLAELWRVRTFPRQLSEIDTAFALPLSDLRALCSGVPNAPDTRLGALTFPGPPRLSASANSQFLRAELPIVLPVTGSQPAALSGTLQAEIPLELQVIAEPDSTGNLLALTIAATDAAIVTLALDPASTIVPSSEANRQALNEKLQKVVRGLLLQQRLKLAVPADFSPALFSGARIGIAQANAITVQRGTDHLLIVGANVEGTGAASAPALASERAPQAPANVRLAVDESFFNETLKALITSGELSRVVNAQTDGIRPITIESGRVRIEDGSMTTILDCVMRDACLNVDLDFTVSVSGRVSVVNGTLTLTTSTADIDLDNTDAVVCTVLSGILGPLGIIFTAAVLSYVAAINPSVPDASTPSVVTSPPLPGSEQRVRLELTSVSARSGTIIASGNLRLEQDTQHTFLYYRLVSALGLPQSRVPVAGAVVTLTEIDRPAPAGDDVQIPDLTERERRVNRMIITTTREYTPRANQSLGSAVSEADGLVRFAVLPNNLGGVLTETEVKEDASTGRVLSTTVRRRNILEGRPDFALSAANADGRQIMARRLVSPNVSGKRVGSLDNPVVVPVDRFSTARP